MATLRDDGDRITVSAFDLRVLTALLVGKMNAYAIARQCEADYGDGLKITMVRSLKLLEGWLCLV